MSLVKPLQLTIIMLVSKSGFSLAAAGMNKLNKVPLQVCKKRSRLKTNVEAAFRFEAIPFIFSNVPIVKVNWHIAVYFTWRFLHL